MTPRRAEAANRVRPLPSPDAAVRLFELDLVPARGDADLALLDDEDAWRVAALPPRQAQRLVTRRALVALTLAELTGVPCARLHWRGGSGRPRVEGGAPSLEVSLSSSGGRALLAVADEPVGVDLEGDKALPDAVGVAEALLPAAEREWVRAAPDATAAAQRLLRTWVRKEAVVKCTGVGLAEQPLTGFVVDARDDAPAPVRDARGESLGFWTVTVRVAGAHAAVALARPPG